MSGILGALRYRVLLDARNFNTGVEGVLGGVKKLASPIGIGLIGASTVNAINTSVNAFASLEQKVAEVFTLLPGMSRLGMEAMQRDILTIARATGDQLESTFKAAYDAISASVPREDLESFLSDVAQLSKAGVTDMATATDALVTSVNAFKIGADNARKANDQLFQIVRLGKTTIPELAKSLGQAFPLAGALGIKLADVGAVLTGLTRVGFRTPRAMTAVRAAMSELSRETTKLGINFKRVSGQSFMEFIEAGGTLSKAFIMLGDAMEKQGGHATTWASNIRAANGIAIAATARGRDLLLRDLNSISNAQDTAGIAAIKFADTTQLAMDKAKRSVQTFIAGLGSNMAPAIKAISEQFAQMFESIPETVARIDAEMGVFFDKERFQAFRKEVEALVALNIDAMYNTGFTGVDTDFRMRLRQQRDEMIETGKMAGRQMGKSLHDYIADNPLIDYRQLWGGGASGAGSGMGLVPAYKDRIDDELFLGGMAGRGAQKGYNYVQARGGFGSMQPEAQFQKALADHTQAITDTTTEYQENLKALRKDRRNIMARLRRMNKKVDATTETLELMEESYNDYGKAQKASLDALRDYDEKVNKLYQTQTKNQQATELATDSLEKLSKSADDLDTVQARGFLENHLARLAEKEEKIAKQIKALEGVDLNKFRVELDDVTEEMAKIQESSKPIQAQRKELIAKQAELQRAVADNTKAQVQSKQSFTAAIDDFKKNIPKLDDFTGGSRLDRFSQWRRSGRQVAGEAIEQTIEQQVKGLLKTVFQSSAKNLARAATPVFAYLDYSETMKQGSQQAARVLSDQLGIIMDDAIELFGTDEGEFSEKLSDIYLERLQPMIEVYEELAQIEKFVPDIDSSSGGYWEPVIPDLESFEKEWNRALTQLVAKWNDLGKEFTMDDVVKELRTMYSHYYRDLEIAHRRYLDIVKQETLETMDDIAAAEIDTSKFVEKSVQIFRDGEWKRVPVSFVIEEAEKNRIFGELESLYSEMEDWAQDKLINVEVGITQAPTRNLSGIENPATWQVQQYYRNYSGLPGDLEGAPPSGSYHGALGYLAQQRGGGGGGKSPEEMFREALDKAFAMHEITAGRYRDLLDGLQTGLLETFAEILQSATPDLEQMQSFFDEAFGQGLLGTNLDSIRELAGLFQEALGQSEDASAEDRRAFLAQIVDAYATYRITAEQQEHLIKGVDTGLATTFEQFIADNETNLSELQSILSSAYGAGFIDPEQMRELTEMFTDAFEDRQADANQEAFIQQIENAYANVQISAEQQTRLLQGIETGLYDTFQEFINANEDNLAELQSILGTAYSNNLVDVEQMRELMGSFMEAMAYQQRQLEIDRELASLNEDRNRILQDIDEESARYHKEVLQQQKEEQAEAIRQRASLIQQAIDIKDSEFERYVADLDESRNRILEEMQQENARYQEQMLQAQREADIEQSRNTIALLEQAIQTKDSDLEQYAANLDEERNRILEEMKEENARYQDEIIELQRQTSIEESKATIALLEQAIQAKDSELAHYAASLDEERNRILEEMKEETARYQEEVAQLQRDTDIEQARSTIALIEQAISTKTSDYEQTQLELDKRRTDILQRIEDEQERYNEEKIQIEKDKALEALTQRAALISEAIAIKENTYHQYVADMQQWEETLKNSYFQNQIDADVRDLLMKESNAVSGIFSLIEGGNEDILGELRSIANSAFDLGKITGESLREIIIAIDNMALLLSERHQIRSEIERLEEQIANDKKRLRDALKRQQEREEYREEEAFFGSSITIDTLLGGGSEQRPSFKIWELIEENEQNSIDQLRETYKLHKREYRELKERLRELNKEIKQANTDAQDRADELKDTEEGLVTRQIEAEAEQFEELRKEQRELLEALLENDIKSLTKLLEAQETAIEQARTSGKSIEAFHADNIATLQEELDKVDTEIASTRDEIIEAKLAQQDALGKLLENDIQTLEDMLAQEQASLEALLNSGKDLHTLHQEKYAELTKELADIEAEISSEKYELAKMREEVNADLEALLEQDIHSLEALLAAEQATLEALLASDNDIHALHKEKYAELTKELTDIETEIAGERYELAKMREEIATDLDELLEHDIHSLEEMLAQEQETLDALLSSDKDMHEMHKERYAELTTELQEIEAEIASEKYEIAKMRTEVKTELEELLEHDIFALEEMLAAENAALEELLGAEDKLYDLHQQKLNDLLDVLNSIDAKIAALVDEQAATKKPAAKGGGGGGGGGGGSYASGDYDPDDIMGYEGEDFWTTYRERMLRKFPESSSIARRDGTVGSFTEKDIKQGYEYNKDVNEYGANLDNLAKELGVNPNDPTFVKSVLDHVNPDFGGNIQDSSRLRDIVKTYLLQKDAQIKDKTKRKYGAYGSRTADIQDDIDKILQDSGIEGKGFTGKKTYTPTHRTGSADSQKYIPEGYTGDTSAPSGPQISEDMDESGWKYINILDIPEKKAEWDAWVAEGGTSGPNPSGPPGWTPSMVRGEQVLVPTDYKPPPRVTNTKKPTTTTTTYTKPTDTTDTKVTKPTTDTSKVTKPTTTVTKPDPTVTKPVVTTTTADKIETPPPELPEPEVEREPEIEEPEAGELNPSQVTKPVTKPKVTKPKPKYQDPKYYVTAPEGYAMGGIVNKKQLAWIAEQGPEAIVPLTGSTGRALLKAAQQIEQAMMGWQPTQGGGQYGTYRSRLDQDRPLVIKSPKFEIDGMPAAYSSTAINIGD